MPTRIPTLSNPATLGNTFVELGDQQQDAGVHLKNAARNIRLATPLLAEDGQVYVAVNALGRSLVDIKSLLEPVVFTLQFIATALNSITIPTISVTKSDVFRVSVVTGITIEKAHPFEQIANRIDTIRTQLADLRTQLGTMAVSLDELRDAMPLIGSSLEDGAGDLKESGGKLEKSGASVRQSGIALGGTPT